MTISPFIHGTLPYQMDLSKPSADMPAQPNNQQHSAPPPPEPSKPTAITRGIDITLRIECRPCIHKLRKKNGIIIESLKYAIVWNGGTNGPTLLGVADEFVNNVFVEYSFSNNLLPLGDNIEDEESGGAPNE